MEQLSQISYIEKQPTLAGNCGFDFDIVLPEYYDSVSKILDCSLIPVCESVNIAGDKVSVAGIGKIQLLYIGEDKRLYSYKNEQKYTKIFQVNNLNASACVDIEQSVSSVNFRALGPKRVSVKANITVCAFPSELKNVDLITQVSEESIEINKASAEIYVPLAIAVRDLSVNGEIAFDDIKEEITEIIRAESVFQINEIKPIHNKLYLSGNCLTSFLCMTDKGVVRTNRMTVPFSEILDINGIEENAQCFIASRVNETKAVLSEFNGINKMSVSFNISVKVSAYVKNHVSYVDDIFSTKKDIQSSFRDIEFVKNIENKHEIITVSVESDNIAQNNFEIIDTWIDDLTAVSAQTKDFSSAVVLSGSYKVLVKNEDGTVNCLVKSFTKDCNLSAREINQLPDTVSCVVSSISSLQTASRTIKTTIDISLNVTLCDICKVNLLSEYKISEDIKTDRVNGVILYFADKGENIWSIAKNNRTSVEKIMSFNSLSDYEIKNDTMLILPNI